MNITITGAGAMSTVCAILLHDNGHRVRMWGYFREEVEALRCDGQNRRYLPDVPLPAELTLTCEPGEAFAGAELIVQTVPTQFIRSSWKGLAPHCPAGVPMLSVIKGIENETLLRPTEVVADVLGERVGQERAYAVLSGPSIAHEVAHRQPATVAVAGTDAHLAELAQRLFSTPWFRVYTNPDMLGVELGGATKNVIAIAAGVLDGLGAGDNAKAALLTRGLVEITRLGVALGARRETFAGLAGLGDLVTTCVSPHGRNRSFGEAIGRGLSVEQALAATHSVVEGVATTRSVVAIARRAGVEMPITEGVHAVLFEGKDVRTAIAELMTRTPKGEDAEWA